MEKLLMWMALAAVVVGKLLESEQNIVNKYEL